MNERRRSDDTSKAPRHEDKSDRGPKPHDYSERIGDTVTIESHVIRDTLPPPPPPKTE